MVQFGHKLSRNVRWKKIRDKGLSETDITLEKKLRYGRTLESTIQQSLVMSNTVHATYTTSSVDTVSYLQQQNIGKKQPGSIPWLRRPPTPRWSPGEAPSTSQPQPWWPGYINEHPTCRGHNRAMQTPNMDTATHTFAQDAGNRSMTELNAGLGGNLFQMR